MSRQRQDLLREAKDLLCRLEASIRADKCLRHQDSHIELETFFRDVLNLVFDWKLADANTATQPNQDSFDLYDDVGKVAVQVTVTRSAAKIRKTLRTFIGTHDTAYDRLVFVYPVIEFNASRAPFSNELNGFDFDASRDCYGFGDILKNAQGFQIDKLEQFVELLRRELKPLGAAIHLGVDQTLETLIAVIVHMSENVPNGPVNVEELAPDQKTKLARFQEHSEYLLDQYRRNQELHVSIEQARDAIGYDTVRVAKIQNWLKSNSVEALADHNDDPMSAFRHLVHRLLLNAHAQGNDAEETAVRFLLADEFIRCNVFPNPRS